MRIGIGVSPSIQAIFGKVGDVPVVVPSDGNFTMSQLAASNRVYQRQTTTGGAQNKGTGTIPVSVNVTSVGTPRFRIRSSDGTTILQASTALAAFTATGAQTLPVIGVAARLGWFYVDLSVDGTTWQNGTVLVGMGRGVAMSGQSQAVRQFGKMPSYTGTNASLGVTIEPNSSVYARYSDSSRSVTTPAWAVPADASNYDSTFAAEFLRRQVATFGVNCFLTGHAVGSTNISVWQPGTQNNVDLRTVLDAVGGFEAFYWHQGGDDAGAGTSAATYQTGLSGVFGDLASHNTARGSSFERYVTAMATRTSGGAGNTSSVQTIRKAASDWAAANSAVYLEPHDVTLEDAVHQGQPGNIVLARHLHRATTVATDNGPTIVSGTRAAAAPIILTTSAAVALVGTPTDRFAIYASGTSTTALAVASLSVSGSTISVTLSADPGNAQALDVYWLRHPDPSGTSAAANMIYDTYTADGLPNGRQLQPTLGGPIVIAAPGGSTPTPTPTPTGGLDNFTAADGTRLIDRPADSGQSWSQDNDVFRIASNRLYATGLGVALLNYTPPTPSYSIFWTYRFINAMTAGNDFVGGHAIDAGNRIQAGYFGSAGGVWSIGDTTNGTYSERLPGVVANLVANTDYALELRFVANGDNTTTVTFFVNGVSTLSYTTAIYPAAGKITYRHSGDAASATSGGHIDSLRIPVS